MKKLTSLTVLFIFILSGCLIEPGFTQKKETRDVDSFTRIGMAVSGDLYLSQGSSFEVILEGPENMLNEIETTVEHNRLRIKYKSNWRMTRSKVNIYVTMPRVEGLAVSGSGNIFNKTALKTDELSLAISGSGNITLDRLMTGSVTAHISGSGNMKLKGDEETSSVEIAISGSGNINCVDLEADSVNAKIAGSGNATVFAKEQLNASIAGSGSIRYEGNPVVNAKIAGSGKVRSIN